MTDEQIIEMGAKVYLCDEEGRDDNSIIITNHLRRFAKLVAQHEREACAEEADKRLYDYTMLTSNPPQNGAAWNIANAIRARGEA